MLLYLPTNYQQSREIALRAYASNIYTLVKGEVVNDTSLSLVAICQSDGLFSEITDWPGCRGAISCDAFPVPDFATTYLLPTESQQVVEYEYAIYSCKDGAMLEGNIAEKLSNARLITYFGNFVFRFW